jgi:DNA-binding CsgD family transcriptional regulator
MQPAHLSRDIAAVVDKLGLEQFILMGFGGLAHANIRYAADHPERVLALVFSSFSIEPDAWSRAIFSVLAEENWDLFLRSQLRPGLELRESEAALANLARTVNQNDYLKRFAIPSTTGLDDVLRRLKTPALVLHSRGRVQPTEESARKLAIRLPDARFVLIDGNAPLGDAEQGIAAIDDFIADIDRRASPARATHGLSPREVEVLRLIVAGKSNQQIADELVLSLNTVIRHVTHIYAKAGVANRAEAVDFAHRSGLAG